MNKLLLSIVGIFLIYGTGKLIGNFFDINMLYILPFISWFIALKMFSKLKKRQKRKKKEYEKKIS